MSTHRQEPFAYMDTEPDSPERYRSLCSDILALQRRYEYTKNPLVVREAISAASGMNPPTIPDWCIPYLHEVAINFNILSDAIGDLPEYTPNWAMRGVNEALLFSRKGKRSVFGDLQQNLLDMQMLDGNLPPSRKEALEKIKTARSVDDDRAARLLSHVKKLWATWW